MAVTAWGGGGGGGEQNTGTIPCQANVVRLD